MSGPRGANRTATLPDLDRTTLARLDPFRPATRPQRILQFGTGRFLRGFLGDFVDRANRRGAFDGRAVVVQSTGVEKAALINRQGGAYTLVTRGMDAGRRIEELRIVDAVERALALQDEWPAVLAVARDPALSVVVSNTTEAGLALDPGDRPDAPRSYPARLTAVLLERYRALGSSGAHGLVVLPCELLEGNGGLLRQHVLTLSRAWDAGEGFHAWLERECRFCNTLVDRIVTGVPPEPELSSLWKRLQYRDELLTIAEPYGLWAIEGEESVRERIGFALANPTIVIAADISRYRELKVRILNGAHTACAALGLLTGHRTVLDAMSDPTFAAFMEDLLREEIAPTLPFDAAQVQRYIDEVLDRFRNPFLQHAWLDITLQYTTKMRIRLVPTIRSALERTGRAPRRLALGFAAYLCFVGEVGDDLSVTAVRAAVIDILRSEELWGADLSAEADFAEQVTGFAIVGLTHGFGVALKRIE